MADIIHNLSVGGTSRPLGTVHYIEGTGTVAGTWLGSDPSITAYYDGLTIAYKVNIAGASTTTLNINSLGAKTVRRNASNLTTQYPVNSVVHLTYTTISGTSYWQCADYDANTDTKNTAGASDTSSKIYLVGTTSQAASAQSYSHDTAYVGTDGCLYSNNTKVSVDGHTHSQYLTAHQAVVNSAPTLAWGTTSTVGTVGGTALTVKLPANPNSDTKNTAGSSDTSSKIFLVGALSQASSGTTYSHNTVYVGTDGCLYSDSKKVSTTDHTHNYAGSASAGGPATNVAVPRVTKSILTIACEQAVDTEAIWFSGSDATTTTEGPVTYCIFNIKKGNNHRTLIDAYCLNDGSHYINYNKSATTVTESLGAWSGWKKQPNDAHTHTVSGVPTSASFSGTTATLTTSAASNTTVATSAHTHTTTSTGSYTPAGTISAPTFTGQAKASAGPSATTTVASSSHTHTVSSSGSYKPAGTVGTPTFTGSAVTSGGASATTSIYSITGVGSAPSLSASIANNCMTFTWSAGSVPTRSAVTVATAHTHSVTAAGTVSAPSFTGTQATISVSGTTATPSATATVPTYNHTHSVTASGTIAAPTFTGTAATISVSGTSGGPSATVNVAAASHTHTVTHTPAGSVSLSTGTKTTSVPT